MHLVVSPMRTDVGAATCTKRSFRSARARGYLPASSFQRRAAKVPGLLVGADADMAFHIRQNHGRQGLVSSDRLGPPCVGVGYHAQCVEPETGRPNRPGVAHRMVVVFPVPHARGDCEDVPGTSLLRHYRDTYRRYGIALDDIIRRGICVRRGFRSDIGVPSICQLPDGAVLVGAFSSASGSSVELLAD